MLRTQGAYHDPKNIPNTAGPDMVQEIKDIGIGENIAIWLLD